jgi:hypothetical protein
VATVRADGISIEGLPAPPLLRELMGNGWVIYLDGEFKSGDGNRFEQFLKKNNVPEYSTVVINSPGGSLLEGIKLGKIIREYNLNTDIGIKKIGENGSRGYENGICFSACGLAFLGGKFRYMRTGARYGVHRFYASSTSPKDLEIAQIISAAIVTYVKEMGVDSDLFNIMTSAGPSEMAELKIDKLTSLRIVNNGFEKEKWTIESTNGMLYLKGERDTAFGINKFIFACGSDIGSLMHIIFDPQGRQNEIMSMQSHSLVIDGKNHKIKFAERRIQNGWFNGSYKLDINFIRMISRSKTVGLILRHSDDSSIFFGFDSMSFVDGKAKYLGLLKNCGLKL